jgi:hypothetical protein
VYENSSTELSKYTYRRCLYFLSFQGVDCTPCRMNANNGRNRSLQYSYDTFSTHIPNSSIACRPLALPPEPLTYILYSACRISSCGGSQKHDKVGQASIVQEWPDEIPKTQRNAVGLLSSCSVVYYVRLGYIYMVEARMANREGYPFTLLYSKP